MQDRIEKKVPAHDKGSIRKHLAPLFLFCSLFIAVALLWPIECLTGESNGKLLFALPIRENETFEVSFTHSLNLSPVTDVVEWTGDSMLLRKSVFNTFGAGIPIPSDGIGTELIHVDGHYELMGIDKPMQSFSIMTQTIPDHSIRFKDQKISLLNLVGSGNAVEIAVKRVPMFQRLRNHLQKENAYVFFS